MFSVAARHEKDADFAKDTERFLNCYWEAFKQGDPSIPPEVREALEQLAIGLNNDIRAVLRQHVTTLTKEAYHATRDQS